MKMPKRKDAHPKLQPMAKAIQAAMKQRGMGIPELTDALGLNKSQRGAVGNWVGGVNAVGPKLRPKVAKVLGLDEGQLIRGPDALGRRAHGTATKTLGPAQRAVALVERAVVNGELLPAAPPVSDVFSFRARSDGTTIVRMEANLPYARGAQLVQMLLSFGLVIGADAEP